jgi:PAS domain S-box-containing protein
MTVRPRGHAGLGSEGNVEDPSFGAQMVEAALRTAAGAIVIIDDKGLICSVNGACETLFGYPQSELIGANVATLMPEPYRSRHDGYIRHHLETGEHRIIGIGRQVMGRRKNGAIFPIHLSVSAFSTQGRRFFTGIIHDLSAELRSVPLREEWLFQAIFRCLPDALLVVDPARETLLCNPAVARIFGYPPEEIIGRATSILFANPADFERVQKFADGPRGKEEDGEPLLMRFRRRSGEDFPAETVISPLPDQEGGRVGFVLLIRDISKQVVQDEALRKSQRMEAIGQLTGGIAHDFNNLLTIITGNHELLETELADAGQRDLLARANNAALMGARLTHRLLTFARRRRLEPLVLDLNEQVMAMAELLRRTLGETIALGTLLAPRLWSVRVDPSEVENAVLNLAINARDAMPSGGKLVIETSNEVLKAGDVANEIGAEPGSYVRLSVSDTGVGMAPEVLSQVFEPFFTTKQPGKGTGLGLSVIYGFVKQSGGHVTIHSQLGKGTTVRLYLPRATPVPEQDSGGQRTVAAAGSAGETILLVEDNSDVRRLTAERLHRLGYAVIEAETGAAALDILKARKDVTLLFSDVVMPGGMSGFDLVAWIGTNAPSVKVLLASGFAEDVVRAGEAVQCEVLRKPYSSAELARALKRARAPG